MFRVIRNYSIAPKGVDKVVNFWFGKPGTAEYLQKKSFWYGNAEDDEFVRQNLENDYLEARKGKLDSWKESGKGSLALIILLDQVPRNIYRDTVKAYETDSKALAIAKNILEKGWDKDQPSVFRRYMYSPFNHSESLEDQETSVRLYKQLEDPEALYWGQHHYDIIKEHGRFPHRDPILGRNKKEN